MKKTLLGLMLIISANATAATDKELNVYTLRQPELINPIFDAFTKETGIKIKATWINDGVLMRLRSVMGKEADLVLTTDASRLVEIAKEGFFTPINSDILKTMEPNLKDENNEWVALTKRVRLIVSSKDRVKNPPQSYEELASPKYKNKICTRSGKHPYNIGVIASMLNAHDLNFTKTWLSDLKSNLVYKPTGNDRAQAKAIYAGGCDISIINSYYLGKMITSKDAEQHDWYDSLNITFPNQADRGAHINISGVGILKSSQNKDNALKLVEYLLSKSAQEQYASLNFEYPVMDVELSPIVKSWGEFKSDPISMNKLVEKSSVASKLVDDVRYDF